MMNLIEVESLNTVGINVDGDIRDEDFDAIASLIKEKMDQHPEVNMYLELENLGKMSPETILKDLKFSVKYMDEIGKEAIVTEKKWVEAITPVADKLYSDIDIKTFSFDERDKAKEWVKN